METWVEQGVETDEPTTCYAMCVKWRPRMNTYFGFKSSNLLCVKKFWCNNRYSLIDIY